MRNYYEPGQWNVICDRCGLKKKSGMLKKEWTGLMVCREECWEPRHPQTMLKVPTDNPSTPWARPEAPDAFISNPEVLTTEDGLPFILTTESGTSLTTEG